MMTAGAGIDLADAALGSGLAPLGSLDLTREQVQSLQSGRLYVQISSEKAPDGNLWGWLLK